jgi:hypothetical protein
MTFGNGRLPQSGSAKDAENSRVEHRHALRLAGAVRRKHAPRQLAAF